MHDNLKLQVFDRLARMDDPDDARRAWDAIVGVVRRRVADPERRAGVLRIYAHELDLAIARLESSIATVH